METLYARACEVHTFLFGGSQGIPPVFEFVREFNFPRHNLIMS